MGCGCGKNTTVVMDGSKQRAQQGSSNFVSVPSINSKAKQTGSAKPSTAQSSQDPELVHTKPSPKQLLDIKPKPELPVTKPESKTSGELPPVRNPKAAPQLTSASTQPKSDPTPFLPEPEAEHKIHPAKSPVEPNLQAQKSLGKIEPPQPVAKAEARKEPEPVPARQPVAAPRKSPEAIVPEKKLPEPIVPPRKHPDLLEEQKSPDSVTEKSPEHPVPPALPANKGAPKPVPPVPLKAAPRTEENKFPPHSPQPAHDEDTLAALVHTDLQSLYSHVLSAADESQEASSRGQAVQVLVKEELQRLYDRVLSSKREEEPVAKDYLQGLYSRVLAD